MRRGLTFLYIAWLYLASGMFAHVHAELCGESGAPACVSDVVIIIRNIISLLAPFAAVAFLIMLIYGGFQFVTSGGDPKAAAAARTTLTFAIIGVILVVGVWLILLLIEYVTGTNLTEVSIP